MTRVKSAGVNQVGDVAVVKANGAVHCRDTDRPLPNLVYRFQSRTHLSSLQILLSLSNQTY